MKNLTVELPPELVELLGSEEQARRDAKIAVVLDLVRRGRVSRARAAELLGLTLWDLPALLADTGCRGVTPHLRISSETSRPCATPATVARDRCSRLECADHVGAHRTSRIATPDCVVYIPGAVFEEVVQRGAGRPQHAKRVDRVRFASDTSTLQERHE